MIEHEFRPCGAVTGCGRVPIADDEPPAAWLAEFAGRGGVPFYPAATPAVGVASPLARDLAPLRDLLAFDVTTGQYTVSGANFDALWSRLELGSHITCPAAASTDCAGIPEPLSMLADPNLQALAEAVTRAPRDRAGTSGPAPAVKIDVMGPLSLAGAIGFGRITLLNFVDVVESMARFVCHLAWLRSGPLMPRERPIFVVVREPVLALIEGRKFAAHYVARLRQIFDDLRDLRLLPILDGGWPPGFSAACQAEPTAIVIDPQDPLAAVAHQSELQKYLRMGGGLALRMVADDRPHWQWPACRWMAHWMAMADAMGDPLGLAERTLILVDAALGTASHVTARRTFDTANELAAWIGAMAPGRIPLREE